MTDKVDCAIFIAMNEDGGWIVTNNESEALEELANAEGGYHARVVKVIVRMTPPLMSEASVDVPDEPGQLLTAEAHEGA